MFTNSVVWYLRFSRRSQLIDDHYSYNEQDSVYNIRCYVEELSVHSEISVHFCTDSVEKLVANRLVKLTFLFI